MQFKKRNIIVPLPIILCLIGYLVLTTYRGIKQDMVSEFDRHQMLLAQQTSRGIEGFFLQYRQDLDFLSAQRDVISMTTQGRALLTSYYQKKSKSIRAITRMNRHGRINFTFPLNAKAVGKDISYQKHVKTMFKDKKPVVSDVFDAVQGYKAVAYHFPIDADGKFDGSLAVLIPFEQIAGRYLRNIKIGRRGSAFMLSQEGAVLFSTQESEIGKDMTRLAANSPSFLAVAQSMMLGEQSATFYQGSLGEMKHVAFFPVKLGNTRWSIAISTPESQALSSLADSRTKLIYLFILAFLLSSTYAFLLLRTWTILKNKEYKAEAEKVLIASEKKYRTLFEFSSDALVLQDTKLHYLDCNEAALKMFGVSSKEELLEQGMLSLSPKEQPDGSSSREKANIEIDRALSTGRHHFQWVHQQLDGTVFPTSVSMTRLDWEKREILLAAIRDTTEQKKAEEELLQSRKMDAIGQLAGGVAHDFNNMLSGIMGGADLLMDTVEEDDKAIVDMILESAERASELTTQLLTFSRKGKSSSTVIDVHQTLRKTLALLERSTDKKIDLFLYEQAESSCVKGDDSQLQSVFLNIGINACQAMPEGGVLRYTTKNVTLDESYCSSSPFDIEPGRFLEIEIEDTGIGIRSEDLDKIFEPFFTTKEQGEGTGLGLASVYGTVQSHGGVVSVTSKPGEGTTFLVYLPLTLQSAVESSSNNELIEGTGRILVVDDEEVIRQSIQVILETLHYEVIVAENGLEAIEIFEKEHKDIDLILLDMIMPEMDGCETFRRAREIQPECKIVVCSGFSKGEDIRQLEKEGLTGFISKPFRKAELSRVIATAMKQS